MVSAHQSKTRGGKVIYSHLYGEMKQKSRDAGMVFSETDTSMSSFLTTKFKEDEARRKEKRELEKEDERKRMKTKIRYQYSTKEQKSRMREMSETSKMVGISASAKSNVGTDLPQVEEGATTQR